MKFPTEGTNYFQFRIKSLRAIGCWPMFGTIKTRFEVFYTTACGLLICNTTLAFLLVLSGLISGFSEVTTFDAEVCDHLLVFLITVQIVAKFSVMIFKAQKLEKIIENLNVHMYKDYVLRPEDEVTMEKCYVYDRKLSIFFFVVSFLISAISLLRPLLTTVRHVLDLRNDQAYSNDTVYVEGLFPSAYPFKYEATSPWYYFWYAQQLAMGLPMAWCSWVSDSMFCGLIRYLCGHFDILIRNVQREEIDSEEKDVILRNKKVYEKLVLHHQYLISHTYELIETFTPLMVVQLLLGAVTIGLVMIQINLTKGDPLQYMKPIAYLILKIVQLLLLSWNGQLLWDKSVEIGDAFFFGRWYEQPPENRRDIKMIIMRSQRPLKFANFGLRLSAPSFFHILNKAYSYYAMLRTMKQDQSD